MQWQGSGTGNESSKHSMGGGLSGSQKWLAFLLLLLPCAVLLQRYIGGILYPRVETLTTLTDCEIHGIDFATITTSLSHCQGFRRDGFQNSEAYYQQLQGKFKPEFCRKLNAFLTITKQRPAVNYELCTLENLSTWRKVACRNTEYAHCFVCERDTGNGNNIYYRAFVFTENCVDGAFLAMSKRARQDTHLKSRVGYFPL